MPSSTITPIVGAHYRPPAKAILSVLPAGAPLWLQPEPTNEFDPNAIKVIVHTDAIPESQLGELELRASGFGYSLEQIQAELAWHLGYIPKDRAAELIRYADHFLGGELCFAADGRPQIKINIAD